jgi:hypothetical protein
MSDVAQRGGLAILLAGLLSGPASAVGPGIHGRILAADKGVIYPAPGATVEFRDPAGRVAATAETDGTGYYRADLPAGTYTYAVHRDKLQPENAGRGVTLRLSDGYAICDITLVPGTASTPPPPPPSAAAAAKLGGRVCEKNKDGTLVGISNAVISFRPTTGGTMTSVLSGRSGTGGYEVILPAGAWRASVRADGFETLLEAQPIDVSADRVTGHDFVLTRQPAKRDH